MVCWCADFWAGYSQFSRYGSIIFLLLQVRKEPCEFLLHFRAQLCDHFGLFHVHVLALTTQVLIIVDFAYTLHEALLARMEARDAALDAGGWEPGLCSNGWKDLYVLLAFGSVRRPRACVCECVLLLLWELFTDGWVLRACHYSVVSKHPDRMRYLYSPIVFFFTAISYLRSPIVIIFSAHTHSWLAASLRWG